MGRDGFWFSDEGDRVVALDIFGDGVDCYDVHRVALQINDGKPRWWTTRRMTRMFLVELFLEDGFRRRYMDERSWHQALVNPGVIERSVLAFLKVDIRDG